MKLHNPVSIAPPFSPYSHGVELPPGKRVLFASGQVGVAPDGSTPPDPLAQNRQAWDNILAILGDAGMGVGDLVRINAYVTTVEAQTAFREVRNEVIGDHRPASTLIRVAGLASDDWSVEIEVVAAAD